MYRPANLLSIHLLIDSGEAFPSVHLLTRFGGL